MAANPPAISDVMMRRHAGGKYVLETRLWLPRGIDEVFEFFADAHRLEDITPPWLNFHVVTPKPVPMFAGATIDYKLRLHGIPLRWRSEISVWDPPRRFVDRQLIGPYRLWQHEYIFTEENDGTIVEDRVNYAVSGGRLIHALFVKRDLERIFAYRTARIRALLADPAFTV